MWSSPLSKDWKEKKDDIKKEVKPKVRVIISKGEGKRLTKRSCDRGHCEWLGRWLKQLVEERCLPPQIAGAEPSSSLVKFMGAEETEKILTKLREDFNASFPITEIKNLEQPEHCPTSPVPPLDSTPLPTDTCYQLEDPGHKKEK